MIRPLTCPICDKPLNAETAASRLAPFCGERCRNVDLLRWSTGRYAIVEPLSDENDEATGPMADPHMDE